MPERVATTDLYHDTAIVAQQRGASIYLLGATKAVVDQAVRRTRELYPTLKIAGYNSGYLRRDGDEERIIADINQARPDILWLGLGAPGEQSFAARNRKTPVRLPNSVVRPETTRTGCISGVAEGRANSAARRPAGWSRTPLG